MKWLAGILCLIMAFVLCGADKPPIQPGPIGAQGPTTIHGVQHDKQRTVTVLFRNEGINPNHTDFIYDSGADVVYLDSLTSATAGLYMAYDVVVRDTDVDSLDAWTTAEANGVRRTYMSTATTFPRGTDQSHGLMWFDLDQLPKNVEITSAELCVTLISSQWRQNTLNAHDGANLEYNHSGIHVVLDTLKSDEGWLGGVSNTGDVRYKEASWGMQDSTKAIPWGREYGGKTYYKLCGDELGYGMRKYSWQWGIKSEPVWEVEAWTSETPSNPDVYLAFDVREAVQQYVSSDDMGNAGWWLFGVWNDGGASGLFPAYGPKSTNANKQIFLKITYKTGHHRQRWNGFPLALCLTTDDDYDDNLVWAASALDYNATMMPFLIESRLDQSGRLTTAEATALSASGQWPGAHSRWHGWDPSIGDGLTVKRWPISRGIMSWLDSRNLGMDSCLIDIERDWIEIVAGRPVHTMGYPSHVRCLSTDSLLVKKGYWGARGGTVGREANSNFPLAGSDTPHDTWAQTVGSDSAYGDPCQALRWYPPDDGLAPWARPVNLMAIGQFGSLCDLVGEWDESLDEDEIRRNLNDIFVTAAVDSGYAAIVLMTHTLKADNLLCGLDEDEWETLLDILMEDGRFWVTSFENVVRHYRATHVPVDAPVWATDAAANGWVAADSLYWDADAGTPDTR